MGTENQFIIHMLHDATVMHAISYELETLGVLPSTHYVRDLTPARNSQQWIVTLEPRSLSTPKAK